MKRLLLLTLLLLFVLGLASPSWAALAYDAGGSGQATDTSATTAVVTITQCAGCLVVVCGVQSAVAQAAFSLSQTGSETFNTLTAAQDSFVRLQSWYAYNTSAGSNTITLTTSSVGSRVLQIVSFSGVTTTDPKDAVGGPTNNSFSTSWASAATGVRAQANEVLVACLGNSVAGAGAYWTPGTTGTTYTEAFESANSMAQIEYSIVSATTSYTGNATAGDGTNGGVMLVGSFLEAAAAGGGALQGSSAGSFLGVLLP